MKRQYPTLLACVHLVGYHNYCEEEKCSIMLKVSLKTMLSTYKSIGRLNMPLDVSQMDRIYKPLSLPRRSISILSHPKAMDLDRLTPCAPLNDTMGASNPLVRLIVLINAFFRCPSPLLATVRVIEFGSSSSSSSTRARLVNAYA